MRAARPGATAPPPFHEVGPADGPVVVLLHEAFTTSSGALLHPVGQALHRAGARLLVPELPMHGVRATQPYDRERHRLEVVVQAAGEVRVLLDHLGAAEATVVGGSLGGLCALSAALADPRLGRVCTYLSPLAWKPTWHRAAELAGHDPGHRQQDLHWRDVHIVLGDQDRWTANVRPPDPEPWRRSGGRLRTTVLRGHGHHQSLDLARSVARWFRGADDGCSSG